MEKAATLTQLEAEEGVGGGMSCQRHSLLATEEVEILRHLLRLVAPSWKRKRHLLKNDLSPSWRACSASSSQLPLRNPYLSPKTPKRGREEAAKGTDLEKRGGWGTA
jgi:hypothetical protein